MRTSPMLSSVIATSLALMACASTPPKMQREAEQRPGISKCMPVQDLAEWQPLTDHTVLLFVPNSQRSRLIVLATPIDGLRRADDIEMVDGDLDGFICPNAVDGIYVRECDCASSSIASIEDLTELQTAELLGESKIL